MGKSIGTKVRRIDGMQKATGKAIYGDDITLPGMLNAAVRYVDIAAGKITNLDISKAEKMPGVRAIASYSDIIGSPRIGLVRQDHLPIIDDEIRYHGDVVAVVAAASKIEAQAAADAIEISYQSYEPITDPQEAVKPTTRLIHPEYNSNIVVHYPLIKGDADKALSESEHVIERTYNTGFVEHAYIEPETVTAAPDHTTGGVQIYGSIQNQYTTRKMVASFMGLNLNQVNVMPSNLGGSFGGKDDIANCMACRTALLTKMTSKPVKLTYNRENSIRESYKRHPYIMKYKVGFRPDGKIKAMGIDILADSGAYGALTFFVNWRSVVQATGPYEIEHVRTDIKGVYTNNCYTSAFRGFGSPQIVFAQESLMDEIASLCNISPLEIRRINGYRQDSITASGQKLHKHTVSLQQVIDEAVAKSSYHDIRSEYKQKNESSKRYKYGIGLACSFRGCSLGAEGTDFSSAIVSVQADSSVIVFVGVNENGQGLRTSLSLIAADALGINLGDIVFLEPQTSTIADGGPTVASRGTMVGGNAVLDAAQQIKSNIFSVIKDELQVTKLEETIWSDGKICKAKSKNEFISFKAAVQKTYAAGVNLSAYGWFKGPKVNWEETTGQGDAYFTYVYGCQIAQVKVDTYTGKIEVEKVTAAHDVGKVINRLGAEGQIFGGVTQGIGYGVLEDLNTQAGVIKSKNLDEYLIPTIKDVPHIEAILVENPDKYGPYGAKSLGEPPIELTAAAINNAYAFACGKFNYRIPLTLEQVQLGKNLRKPERQSAEKQAHNKRKSPYLADITTSKPKKLSAALDILADEKHKILAGGTDILVTARHVQTSLQLVDISSLPELKGITENEDELIISAGETFSRIVSNSRIKKIFPLLVEACKKIGSLQIRNRATIGGNIVNAAPCADSVPPLIAYDAKVKLVSSTKERIIPLATFIEHGYKTGIKKNELLTEIIIPKLRTENIYHSYYQLGRRNSMSITRMSVSIILIFDDKDIITSARLVDGAMFSRPQRIYDVEDKLLGNKLTDNLILAIEKPLSDKIESEIGGRWSAVYKKPVFISLCQEALLDILRQRKEDK
jgi:CO/xanthine dehydrogenase Mo-binding subunit/CO/xanthine dehydrogenase FAD-binding subunit